MPTNSAPSRRLLKNYLKTESKYHKSPDHDFLNFPVHMPDEEGRCGVGNERQGHVCLRFTLYQVVNSPVLIRKL
jgi:hypothetical protein